jgi:hypothetical protein
MRGGSKAVALLAALLWIRPGLGRGADRRVPLGQLTLQLSAAPGLPPQPGASAETPYFAGDGLASAQGSTGVLALAEGVLALASGSRASVDGGPGAYEVRLQQGALRLELPPGSFRVHAQGLQLRAAPAAWTGRGRVIVELGFDEAGRLYVHSPQLPLEVRGETGIAQVRAPGLEPLCALAPVLLGEAAPCRPGASDPARAAALARRLLGAAQASVMVASAASTGHPAPPDAVPADR